MRPTRLAVLVLCRPPRLGGGRLGRAVLDVFAAGSLPEASPP
jgi:hypothetical protein